MAIATLKRSSSASVKQTSKVFKEIVDENGNVDINRSQAILSEILIDEESSTISTKIVAQYYDPAIQKQYLWVVEN